MAIDYGTKRIGIAVTDPLQIIANGLDTVETKNIFEFLADYFENEPVPVVEIVIGEPRHKDGNPTFLTPIVHKFGAKIEKKYPDKKITFVDESFTSSDAKAIILQSGAKRKKRRDKGLVDKISAVLILQQYLESKR